MTVAIVDAIIDTVGVRYMRDIEKAIDALARNPKSVKFSELSSLCAEFPSLSWLAASPDEALDGIRKLVGEVLEDMEPPANDRPPPSPTASTAAGSSCVCRPRCIGRWRY